MSLRNIIQRELICCSPTTSIQDVADLMDKKNVGSVVIVEGKKPVGIVTDRDITLRCVVHGKTVESPVKDIMTDTVHTVNLDEGIFNVAEIMRKQEIRRVPIVDEKGYAIGLISFGDVFELVGKELSCLMAPTSPEVSKISKVSEAA